MSASEGRKGPQSGFECTDAACSAYHFMVLDTTCTSAKTVVKMASAATSPIIGVSYEATAAANRNVGVNHLAGMIVPLMVNGVTPGAISINSRLTSDASGHGVATTTAGNHVGAIALAASTTAGEVIPVMLTGPGAHGAS